ncbi:MAG: DNA cytosine methyltransferase [Sediminibacterium sp.]
MKILVACEESQAITKEFRALGHEAYSCDILPCTGGHPEWHLQGDVFCFINQGWDLMVAHPPCTYLSVSGARHLYNKDGSKNLARYQSQREALDFVQKLMDCNIPRIAIENPVSVISSQIRKPDQIVHPWMFGDSASKTTCLWLKNLPKLVATNVVDKGDFKEWIDKKSGKVKRQATWYYDALINAKSPEERRSLRSKTFKGIAQAIASQWGIF